MNNELMQCKQLSKSFAQFQLGPINATFHKGMITGIFGPNGAGKTTLISLLMGTIEKDSGQIVGRHGLSCSGVFDRTFLLPHTKVVDQLSALCVAVGKDRESLKVVLNECNLQPYLTHRISKLSTGNKQRLALALAIIQDPDIYIFDEPLNGLDPEGIEWFNTKLRDISKKGKTLIFATHLLAEAEAIVDRCIFLVEGQVIYEGNVQDILKSIRHLGNYVYINSAELGDQYNEQNIVYRSKELIIAYNEEKNLTMTKGVPLNVVDQTETHIPLTALYRLKKHNFGISEGLS